MAAEESKIGELLSHCNESIEKIESSEEGPWKNLPEELVHNILTQLVGRDFIALQSVCKSWKSSTMSSPILSPCLLVMSSNRLHYPISNSTIANMNIYDCGNTPSSIIGCSNYNWLLMRIDPKNSLTFFNPFTNVKIELPTIHLISSLSCFSFSAPPTSPDCTVFCICTDICDKIYFCILRRFEREWNILEYDRDADFIASSSTSLFYKGRYYYSLSKQGDLVIYDMDDEDEQPQPRWIKSSTSFLRNRLSTKRCQSFMTESDEGELLVVFMSCDGQWVQVCKLDESRMIWVPVHDLGNKSIFISNPATFVETIKIKGTQNKIYVPWFRGTNVNNKQNKVPLFYSVATRKYHSFGASASYSSLYESTRPASNTWIKPISHHHLTCNTNLHNKFTW
ncbi:hypothetical protein EJD97_001782 [Solanum chilense]|uniref:F-box domain-containing protein n=1 Tax=Solanum chilense TaxID=4083 RepID=A0A6N2CDL2_SOLCI|nr:hypothetical protein EJD97_001782 [Solanum chilense]